MSSQRMSERFTSPARKARSQAIREGSSARHSPTTAPGKPSRIRLR